MLKHRDRFLLLWVLMGLQGLLGVEPVAFSFIAPRDPESRNPYARELWAEVTTPSGRRIVLPAFYEGNGKYTVHARPDEVGAYRMGPVAETTPRGRKDNLPVNLTGPSSLEVRTRIRLPAIQVNQADPHGFIRSDGRPYLPVGANVAWAEGDLVPFYLQALAASAQANLNWMRIWMCHWGRLNLDWIHEGAGGSPRPGGLDPGVAASWDAILSAATEQGVYVQLVLQHHGQYSTKVNPNWSENPWNAANPGGFLHSPTEFFTSLDARLITMLKYRYIVARWGWSPAVFAWELFNEVHWVDAIHEARREDLVARWHDEMADYLRSIDVYGHLVTTSTDDVASPIYAKMDFYQPHLYPGDLLVAARGAVLPAGVPVRPVFYGEVGDENTDLPERVRQAGGTLVPPVWAALMGPGRLPAQTWTGARLLQQGQAQELGAVQRFALLSRFAQQHELRPFSPVVECATKSPLVLAGVQVWRRQRAADLVVPIDGSVPLEWTHSPRIFVGKPASVAEGYPSSASYQINLPHAATLHARVVKTGAGGAALRISIDGQTVAEQSWPAERLSAANPADVSFAVPAGPHRLQLANPGGADWFELSALDLGLETSVLAAFGQRSDRYIAVWLWHRNCVYWEGKGDAVAGGTLLLDEVPAGEWSITWWETLKGAPAGPTEKLNHPGGALRLPVPAVSRHTAVVLTR